jgi:Lrp/AsnC family leucine-responsive transcriptional regulator
MERATFSGRKPEPCRNMEKIDTYDRILLETLQRQGRASNVELSERVGLSAPQCYRRVRRLETEGIIRSYAAQLNPASIGLDAIAYVSVTVDRSQAGQIKEFEETLRNFPEVLECYSVSGDGDYFLKAACPDLKKLSAFLNEDLTAVKGVAGIKSTLCMHEVKTASPLPIGEHA